MALDIDEVFFQVEAMMHRIEEKWEVEVSARNQHAIVQAVVDALSKSGHKFPEEDGE